MEGNIKELLTRGSGTEGSLLIPKTIYRTIVDAVDKKRIPRELAAIFIGPTGVPGSSVDIDLEDKDSMQVVKVAEGAPIPIGTVSYSSFNVKPDKYAVRPLITKEMMEDSKWNLMAHNLKRAGKEMGENETTLIITQALDNAGNTVSGGAAITPANITRGIQYLEDNDYEATDMLSGPEVMNDLRNIDTFVEVDKSGSTEALREGMIRRLYGMNVHLISGNLITSTTSYIIDRAEAFVLVEKRPVTVENYDDFIHDMSGSVVTQRIRARQLRANAICKITTS